MTPRYAIADSVAWRVVEDQVFAVTSDGTLHHIKSPTGVFIWSLLDQGVGEMEPLLARILETFEVDRETAQADLVEFLSELLDRGCIMEK